MKSYKDFKVTCTIFSQTFNAFYTCTVRISELNVAKIKSKRKVKLFCVTTTRVTMRRMRSI